MRGRVRAFLPDAFESEGSEALLAVRPSFQAGNCLVPSPGSTKSSKAAENNLRQPFSPCCPERKAHRGRESAWHKISSGETPGGEQ